jgi:NADH-quinone oxidoreductase subunit M
MNAFPWITILTLVPFCGGVLLLCLPAERKGSARLLGLTMAFASLALALVIWTIFQKTTGTLQLQELHDWIPTLGVRYHVGLDGLSLLMVLLSTIVVPMALLASWNIQERVPAYFGLVLLLEAGLIGTFTALNFFHWFLFWELSLIPAFFLIKFWGGPLRSAAATQFFVYTMVGSVGLLLAFLAIFLTTNKFDFVELSELGRNGSLISALSNLGWRDLTARSLGVVIFALAFLGLAVKVPLVPFHTWLPTAYAEAPTGTTMLLTGLMSKMGVYGFVRILVPIFPEAMRLVITPLLWLAAISIVFSAGAAFAQRDLKRMLAYSSINHLGYCLLGIFAVMNSGLALATPAVEKTAALNGVFLQMFNHGLTAAALFWFVGLLEQRGRGLRGIDDFGGLRKVAPIFCGLMGIALFSSLGLPGLNGFIGEFLIFKGAFPLASVPTAVAVLGLLVTAIFILTLLQRVFNGPLHAKWAGFADLTTQERILLAPAIALMFVLGIYPQLLLGFINSTSMEIVKNLRF